MKMSSTVFWLLLSFLQVTVSADPTHSTPLPSRPESTESRPATEAPNLKVCAAVRGNGDFIFTHFASLARISESYGVVDALAGGSSASLTAFLYESMVMNPAVAKCGSRPCNKMEKGRRVALMLKSIEEYIEVLKESKEGMGIIAIIGLIKEVQKNGIETMLKNGEFQKAAHHLKNILDSSELKSVVNPDVFRLLSQGRAQEVYDQIVNFGKFEAKSKDIFFRPGLISFSGFAKAMGRLADFYAGRGPSDQLAMEEFLNKCAGKTTGLLWEEIRARANDRCALMYRKMASNYRNSYEAAGDFNHRLQDPIGGTVPALISTSVLEGYDMVDRFNKNMDAFWASPNAEYDFDVSFDQVKFGYWGRPSDLKNIEAKFQDTKDLKSSKFLAMGPAGTRGAGWTSWEEALRTSPAEPGLANIQKIDDRRLSVGGWSDLQPVPVLKAIGCENVIYVTRQGNESQFATGVARLLGMKPEEERALYASDVKDGLPLSSFASSIKAAEGVWCTDWNKFVSGQIKEMIRDSYHSPIVTKSKLLAKPKGKNPPTILSTSNALGCF